MKRRILLFSLWMTCQISIHAQELVLNNVMNFFGGRTGHIMKNDELVGYYTFYVREREDQLNYIYEVIFLDNNLKEATRIRVIKPANTFLTETVYNDDVFLMIFREESAVAMETYDHEGNLIGSKRYSNLSGMEVGRMTPVSANLEMENTNTYPLGDQGFVRSVIVKNVKTGFKVMAYDNELNPLWSSLSDPNSQLLEVADIVSASEKYIAMRITKRKTLLSKKYDTFFCLLDAKTGERVIDLSLRDLNDGDLSLINVFVDEENDQVLLTGEYYLPGDEVLKDASAGIYARRISMDGLDIDFKHFGWDSDIANYKKESMSEEEQALEKGKPLIYFHKFFKSVNGHIFGIGEEYRKTFNALGGLTSTQSGQAASTSQLTITNLILIELDENLEMVKFAFIPKKKTRVSIPDGMGAYGPQMLAMYVKSEGWFDYKFTSIDKQRDSFSVVYTDGEHREENSKEAADMMMGVINVVDGVITTSKQAINSNARSVGFSPAKTGFIMIYEYYKSYNKVVFHLEPINN